MELLDRYLEAVRKHLPWKRQADILAELRANLEAQLEDRQAELGRPLTQAEMEGWLRALGAPIQVAARYQPQQYLIGPRLFPIYLAVLRTGLPWVAAIYFIVWVVGLFASASKILPAVEIVFNLPWTLFLSAAIITAVFAGVEFLILHFPERFPKLAGKVEEWSPADLPPLPSPGRTKGKPRSLASAIAQVVFGAFFLVWWLLVPHYPVLLLGPGVVFWRSAAFDYAPVLVQFYWCVAVLNLVQLIWRAVDLARDAWQQRSLLEHRVTSILGMIPLALLVFAPGQVYFRLKNPELTDLNPEQIAGLNQVFHLGFSICLAIAVFSFLWAVVKYFLDDFRQRASAR